MSSKLIVAVLVIGSMFSAAQAQESGKAALSERVAQQALQYFAKAEKSNLEDYLKSIRAVGISADERVRVVASIKKEDIVLPSEKRQAKLDALRPILAYHDRADVEVKVLRLGLAWAGFLEGAAIVVSEEAVDILSAEELQAVVAHELGHEYFAAEYDVARKNRQYDKVREVELRCDAVAIITMKGLGLNANSLLSGVSRLTKFNEGRGVRTNPDLVTSLDERLTFCASMTRLAETRVTKPRETASEHEPAGSRTVSSRVLSSDLIQQMLTGPGEDVTAEFEKAWRVAGAGVRSVEGVVLLYRKRDGSIMAKSQGLTNERLQFTFKWNPTIIGVVHTHPNDSNPRPGGNDLELADKLRVPIFTITNRGMFAYDPATRKTTMVATGLTWLRRLDKSRDSNVAAKP